MRRCSTLWGIALALALLALLPANVIAQRGSGVDPIDATGPNAASAIAVPAAPVPSARPGPELSIRPAAVSFDTVPLGGDARRTLVVRNDGQILLKIDSMVVLDGEVLVDPSALKVTSGDSAEVLLTYAPTRVGTLATWLIVYHNAPGGVDSVALGGEALGVPECLILTPALDFGEATVGTTVWDSIAVFNPGSAVLRIDSVTSPSATFLGTAEPQTVDPGETLPMALGFAPREARLWEEELRVWHNAAGAPGVVAARGRGIAPPACELRPDSILVGDVEPGQTVDRLAMMLNTGGSELRVDSLRCTVEGFAIVPETLLIAAGDSAVVTVRFAPQRDGIVAGEALFYHNAAGGSSRLYLYGECRGTPLVTVGKAAVSFGTILLGQSALDSVEVANPGTAELRIDSARAQPGEFSVEPSRASVPAGATRWFRVKYLPGSGGSHTGVLSIWHNAAGSPLALDLSGAAIAPPPPPLLLAPAPGEEELAGSVELSWQPCPEATAYRLEIATDGSFAHPLRVDTLGLDTVERVEPLAYNTIYHWRVTARNAAGWGVPSEALTFRTSPGLLMSTAIEFPDETPASYRLAGIPGTDALTVADVLEGRQKFDWRLYGDNGATVDYLIELSSSAPLSAGEGYWMLRRGAVDFARTLTMPALDPDGSFTIPLHPGPNIISNPFDRPVAWRDVVEANGEDLAAEYPLGFARGSYAETVMLEPFIGYYIRNLHNRSSLKIPYPFHAAEPLRKAHAPLWTLEIGYEGEVNADRGTLLGVAEDARDGRDRRDRWKPGPALDLCYIGVRRPDIDDDFPYLGADIRSAGEEGYAWDLEIGNPTRGPGTIVVEGVEHLPAALSVICVDLQETVPVDLRLTPRVPVAAGTAQRVVRIIAGSSEYASRALAELVPDRLALLQNYPNPFNPATAIPFTLPRRAAVRLEVISLVGETVRTLVDGPMEAGLHTVEWDGTDGRGRSVSSGVYFCRLQADRTVVAIRKLVLLK